MRSIWEIHPYIRKNEQLQNNDELPNLLKEQNLSYGDALGFEQKEI